MVAVSYHVRVNNRMEMTVSWIESCIDSKKNRSSTSLMSSSGLKYTSMKCNLVLYKAIQFVYIVNGAINAL